MPITEITDVTNIDLASIIKPIITHDASVIDINNPALKKVADDVLDALKMSITAVAANPDAQVRIGSAESDFKEALKSVKATRADEVNKMSANAVNLLKAPKEALRMNFGRFAELPAEAVARQGFDRVSEGLAPLMIEPKLFGLGSPKIDVPLNMLKATNEGLLIPKDRLPANFEAFESLSETSFEESLKMNVLDQEIFASYWSRVVDDDPFKGTFGASEFEAVTPNKLGLYIRRVKCEDETNPEWWGDDEIALGAVAIDSDGDVFNKGETYIGGGFHDGKQKTYSNWLYHSFSLTDRIYWPKKFGITLTLAEKDWGGFSSFLNNLWKRIKDAVFNALKAAAMAAGVALATYLGLPEFGPVIGKAIGEVVAWLLDKLIDWLIKLFGDDIFKPFTAWCNVPSLGARWNYSNGTWGNPWSPVNWVRYSGYGGRYLLEYQWRIYA
ncbi:MAG: hypothetical protein PSV18_11820 [Methylobacter sp.]|nr:hypothetical protein [Candidatus Methylobacter titanis]